MHITCFDVKSALGKRIRITKQYWNFIIEVKHPSMKGKENQVKETLINPDEIRKSKKDSAVYLYYKKVKKVIICVVCRHINGEGYVITTYPTYRIKEGESIWKKR